MLAMVLFPDTQRKAQEEERLRKEEEKRKRQQEDKERQAELERKRKEKEEKLKQERKEREEREKKAREEREAKERREKHRLSRIADETWMSPRKWLALDNSPHDSPHEEDEGRMDYFDSVKHADKGKLKEVPADVQPRKECCWAWVSTQTGIGIYFKRFVAGCLV